MATTFLQRLFGLLLTNVVALCLLVQTGHSRTLSGLRHSSLTQTNATYFLERDRFLVQESHRVVGEGLVLNEAEKAVDKILLAAKEKEIQQGFTTSTFPPSVNFLSGKPLVEKSPIFNIIRRMPKGGILHLHEISLADPDWVISNITYLPHLYFCVCRDYYSSLHFKFSTVPPAQRHPQCGNDWKLVATARTEVGAKEFDSLLYRNLTMFSAHPDEAYPNTTMCWLRFGQVLGALTDLYFYEETMPAFLRKSFTEMVSDNVQYIEIRTLLLPLQSANGITCSTEHTLQQFIKAFREFQQEHSKDFVLGKIILTSERHPVNRTRIFEQVKQSMVFRRDYPQYFAGYDLVSQEDKGGPLIDYINQLLYPSQQGVHLPYYFHAGETDWEGTFVDRNLIDAVLLNASRIGHGYAIVKHPSVMEKVKTEGIAIEMNPISNQVLHLVHDIRDHMGTHLIADDYPVVISSDDPSVWGALPLSHDFYMAFMGMSGQDVGLTLLKQLALNSFKYSAMTADEKLAAIQLWQAKWDLFIDDILATYG